MDLGLKDCKAFVAGASKGLGKACAKALAGEGARVFICSRNEAELKQAAAEIGAQRRCQLRFARFGDALGLGGAMRLLPRSWFR